MHEHCQFVPALPCLLLELRWYLCWKVFDLNSVVIDPSATKLCSSAAGSGPNVLRLWDTLNRVTDSVKWRVRLLSTFNGVSSCVFTLIHRVRYRTWNSAWSCSIKCYGFQWSILEYVAPEYELRRLRLRNQWPDLIYRAASIAAFNASRFVYS